MQNQENLQKRVQALNAAFGELGDQKPLNELLIFMKRPGWTTPAEFLLVSAIVDSMLEQVNVLANLKVNLVKGGGAVTRIS